MNYSNVIKLIESNGYECKKGLTNDEIHKIETDLKIVFPSEYKDMLKSFLPIGKGFIDWKNVDNSGLRQLLLNQFEGILFDVEHNGFRYEKWGVCPEKKGDKISKANYMLKLVKPLIPVFGHRYISQVDGGPVFSIYQTDIIVYGKDLESYMFNEFSKKDFGTSFGIPIPFRSDLVLMNNMTTDINEN